MMLPQRTRDRVFKTVFPYLLGAGVMGLYFLALESANDRPEWDVPRVEAAPRSTLEDRHARSLAARMASYENDRLRDDYYKGLSPYEKRLLFRFDIDVRAGRTAPVGDDEITEAVSSGPPPAQDPVEP